MKNNTQLKEKQSLETLLNDGMIKLIESPETRQVIHRCQSTSEYLKQFDPILGARIFFELYLINRFEHALLALKKDDCVWGPVHSSVGQEAVAPAVSQALRKSDKFLGAHRSHHHFLSKAFHYVLPEQWDPRNEELPDSAEEVLRRTMAEVMGLQPGYCGGRGGSMHLRWAEAGFLGCNAIVGGGIPAATGAAFAEKYLHSENIIVSFFGEGACNQGTFVESLNMAAIWNLPIIYLIENNHYAVGTNIGTVCKLKDLAARAPAFGMQGYILDANDPLALYTIVRHCAWALREGGAPVLIEVKCYRHYHHAGDTPGSAFKYRTKEEENEWKQKDTIERFPEQIIEAGLTTRDEVIHMRSMADRAIERAMNDCSLPGSPRTVRSELWPRPETLTDGLRSSGSEWEGIEFCEREDFTDFEEMSYVDAIAAVTGRWMEKDERVFVIGEEVANFGGGAYQATKGLPIRFPDRVFNTPISEAGFVGIGLGAAIRGLRPVIEIMFPDFSLVSADQLFHQIAKIRHMYGNTCDVPLVCRTRIAVGCGYGGQHSMDPIGLYTMFTGWRIVVPANAFDFVGLFNSAMQSLDPVLIIEHHTLYPVKSPIPSGNLDYFIPFGKARVVKPGDQVTVITYGMMANRCEALHEQLAGMGVSAEIIDLRSVDIPSIDYETIGESFRKTKAAVIVEEAPASHSIGPIIAARIQEKFFYYLDSPTVCVTSVDVPNPVSRVLERAAILSDDKIVETVAAVARRSWC